MRKFIQSLPHPIANTLMMVRRLPTAFYGDGLLTVTNADFRKTRRFSKVYAAAKATGSFSNWDVQWRVHVLTWMATQALRVKGDFIECGTDHGGTAMAVMEHLDFAKLGRKFWLLDTFSGLDRSQKKDDFFDYSDCYEQVKETFSGRDYVRIVRGSIPSTLAEVKTDRVAFLHLDMNSTIPEIAALECFWPMMPPGGVVVMDDYGWPRHKEQKAGFDLFAERTKAEILQLPTSQGIIIKQA